MKIYVMRHGTTVWNEQKITQGRSQNRLSKNGKCLVEEVAKKYKNAKFDVIFSSPLMRTIQTANIMNKYHNTKIVKDERIIEINQGIFTGRCKKSFTEEEKLLRKRRDASCGMENYESVFNRTKDFLLKLKQQKTYDNVLIITHAVPARLLEKIICKEAIDFADHDDLHNYKNAEIKCFDL